MTFIASPGRAVYGERCWVWRSTVQWLWSFQPLELINLNEFGTLGKPQFGLLLPFSVRLSSNSAFGIVSLRRMVDHVNHCFDQLLESVSVPCLRSFGHTHPLHCKLHTILEGSSVQTGPIC